MAARNWIRHGVTAGLIAAFAVGCGGNPEIASSNRGAGSDTSATTVENAFIVPRYIPGSCAIQVGDAAVLTFTATNNRGTEAEQLLGIESPAADTIRISPPPPLEIAPRTSIAAAQPIEDVSRPGGDRPFTVTIETLKESATPGKSVDVTFRFEQHGDLTLKVPIEACPTQK